MKRRNGWSRKTKTTGSELQVKKEERERREPGKRNGWRRRLEKEREWVEQEEKTKGEEQVKEEGGVGARQEEEEEVHMIKNRAKGVWYHKDKTVFSAHMPVSSRSMPAPTRHPPSARPPPSPAYLGGSRATHDGR